MHMEETEIRKGKLGEGGGIIEKVAMGRADRTSFTFGIFKRVFSTESLGIKNTWG